MSFNETEEKLTFGIFSIEQIEDENGAYKIKIDDKEVILEHDESLLLGKFLTVTNWRDYWY